MSEDWFAAEHMDVLWKRIYRMEEDERLQRKMVDEFYRLTSEVLEKQWLQDTTS